MFANCEDKITCVNGDTGDLLWQYTNGAISSHAPFEIQDLNNDGIPELVVSCYGRTIALHADDGSVYWNNPLANSMEKHLVISNFLQVK